MRAALLLGCGLAVGAAAGLNVVGIIRSTSHAGESGPLLAAARPAASDALARGTAGAPPLFALCEGDCFSREIGYSWAAALRMESPEHCRSLPGELIEGCIAFTRARRPAGEGQKAR